MRFYVQQEEPGAPSRIQNTYQTQTAGSSSDFKFDHFLDVIEYFKKVINLCKQMNYQPFESDKYFEYEKELQALLAERKTA